MKKFRAYRIEKDEKVIQGNMVEMTLDELMPGEVLIKSNWSSINYKDALAGTGKGKILSRFPLNGGIDVAGEVVESSDDRYKPGDQVLVTGYELGTGHDGGYSEFTRVPGEWVVALPEGLTPRQAMILGTAGFTAGLCISRMELNGLTPESGPVVVTGATGGVGSLGINMLAGLGYEVVAVSGKAEANDELKELGASRILDRHTLDFGSRPLERAEWAGAIDNVGGDMLTWLTRTMQPLGSIASVGLAGGASLNTTVMPFILRGVNLLGITSSGAPTAWRQPLWSRLASDLKPRHLDDIVTEEVGLDDLNRVFNAMLEGKTQGRTLVKIAD